MRNFLSTIAKVLLLLVTNCTFAQSPSWLWAKQVSDFSDQFVSDITTDATGNVYTLGAFTSNNVTFGTSTFTNNGTPYSDLFVTKYDGNGNFLWAKWIGGTGSDEAAEIRTDNSGNVYVAGTFYSPVLSIGTTTLTNTGGCDLFLAKYDPNGNLIWVKSANGLGGEQVSGMTIDGSGNIFLTGQFASTTFTVGSYVLTSTNTSFGNFDIYFVKFDTNGNVLMAKSTGGSGPVSWPIHDYATGIATDASGNIYITGLFLSAVFNFGSTTLNNVGNADALVLKYDASGNEIWARSAGGTAGDIATGIQADVAGNVYVTGYFDSPSFAIGTALLNNAGNNDIFVFKLNTSGNTVWAKCIGGSAYERGSSIALDPAGNVYITGSFYSASVTFGSITLNNNINSDVFVTKYDASGNALWAVNATGNATENGNGICLDPTGNVFVVGDFSGTSTTLGSTTLINAGGGDGFIAKLGLSSAGIKESTLVNKADIFPNPFATETTISFDKYINNISIQFYNIMGQNVKQIDNVSGQNFKLSCEDLQNGLYFVRILSDKKIITENKIIISE